MQVSDLLICFDKHQQLRNLSRYYGCIINFNFLSISRLIDLWNSKQYFRHWYTLVLALETSYYNESQFFKKMLQILEFIRGWLRELIARLFALYVKKIIINFKYIFCMLELLHYRILMITKNHRKHWLHINGLVYKYLLSLKSGSSKFLVSHGYYIHKKAMLKQENEMVLFYVHSFFI